MNRDVVVSAAITKTAQARRKGGEMRANDRRAPLMGRGVLVFGRTKRINILNDDEGRARIEKERRVKS